MDPVWGGIIVATIAGPITTLIAIRPKVSATHRQVTVNHHSSKNPTVLDLISDLTVAQTKTHDLMVEHLADHAGRDLHRNN